MPNADTYNRGLIYTEVEGCIDCNKCIHECPILKSNVSVACGDGTYKMCVDENECILCGTCIDTCIHDVRHFRDDFADFLSDLSRGKEFSVLVAPAFYLNYPDEGTQILGWLKSLGVKNFYPVSFGADITTWGYVNYLKKTNVSGNIAQPCPTIVRHIEKNLPELLPKIIPVQSPLMCAAIYLRKYRQITDDFVFLSPCISKKTEIESKRGLGLVKYNVTFKNLSEHINTQSVSLETYPSVVMQDEFSELTMGSLFPKPGGLCDNIEYYMGSRASVYQAEGERRAYKYLESLSKHVNSGYLPMIIDIMNCESGCGYGTGTELRRSGDYNAIYQAIAMREEKIDQSILDPAERVANLNERFKDLAPEDFLCEYERDENPRARSVTPEEIEEVFRGKLVKLTDNDKHVDCAACGYETCGQMAEAIALGINHHDNCVYYVKNALAMSNRAKSRFLARMSHEIRTPMNAILGTTEIELQNDILSPETESAFMRIHNSSTMLLGLINDILDLSKVEAGKMEIVPAVYEMASMIIDTVQLNIMYIGSKQIKFKLHVDENLPAYLVGDELRIKQILNNVLSNAFKYTSKGEVHLSFSAVPSDEKGAVVLEIKVDDTGQGLTQEQLEVLQDEFERFNLERNRNVEGAGLGLSIAYQIAYLMDGEISVQSTPDVGSTFTVRLPQKISGKSLIGEKTAAALQNLEDTQKSLKRMEKLEREPMPYGRVLVVDDVESNLFVAKGFLTPYRLAVETVDSGILAVEKIRDGEVYDIIFMDHMMPQMDGIEATTIMREMGYNHPIIALTANAFHDMVDMFKENGFTDFAAKPININQMDAHLMRYIRDKQPPEVIADARQGKKIIFVVDDVRSHLQTCTDALSGQHTVFSFVSGAQMFKIIEKKIPDLIILDVEMPEMDGHEVFSCLKSDERFAHIPVIFLSAYEDKKRKEQGFELGALDCLDKPLDAEVLRKHIAFL
ncbi:MAG: response regulator [Defluviitaleaceae bacterium]|nr:response regulator [Defluviitaleaceae bacterium]